MTDASKETNTGSMMRHRVAAQASVVADYRERGDQFSSPSSSRQMGPGTTRADQTSRSDGGANSLLRFISNIALPSFVQRQSAWTQYDETSPYKIRNTNGVHGTCGDRWKSLLALAVGLFLLLAPWMRHFQAYWKVRSLQDELENLQNKQIFLKKEIKNQVTVLKKIKSESTEFKSQNDILLGHVKTRGDDFDDFDSSAYQKAEELENDYLQRVDELEREIQRSAARKLVYHGHGVIGSSAPMRAVVSLAIDVAKPLVGGDEQESPLKQQRTLVLEMAPTHTYSHAIAYFMDLVHKRRTFDGWTFMRTGGGSVLYTVPMDFRTNKFLDFSTMEHFEMSKRTDGEALLDRLAVLEHPQVPSDYPIEKYSGRFVLVLDFVLFDRLVR